MKRLLSLFFVLSLIFSLTSCTSKPVEIEPEEPIQEEIIEEIPETPEITAGVFWYNFKDAFLSTVRTALNTELNALGIEHKNYDAQNEQELQNKQIDEAIAEGANLLIVNIVDTAAIDTAHAIVNKAKNAGIPIIFFNREVADEVINSYENACFVGTRIVDHRILQGKMIAQYILENYDEVDLNGDGNISYIFMKGSTSGGAEYPPEVMTENIISCNAELTEAGKPELTYYDQANTDKFEHGNWSRTEAFNLMETALSTNPMDSNNAIEIVITSNHEMALGCIEALNNAGWNMGGDSPTIPVFGVDYTADAAAAIEAGKMTGSILQSATGMAETVAALVSNVINESHVFDGAVDFFNVDENCNKIRVPYEIIG